jgi:hypothetical protein
MIHIEEILISTNLKIKDQKSVFLSNKENLITRKYEQKLIKKRNTTLSLALSF